MAFNVPVCVYILGVVRRVAGHLDLLESPLWQWLVGSSQIATNRLVTESNSGRQGVNLVNVGPFALMHVIHNLDDPIIVYISDRGVTVTRNFPLILGNRCWDRVRV